jgi:cytochrome c oxidase subunit 2
MESRIWDDAKQKQGIPSCDGASRLWRVGVQPDEDGNDMALFTLRNVTGTALAAATAMIAAGAAHAQVTLPDLPIVGAPVDGATGFQPAVTSVARDLQWLDGMINVIIFAITIFVTALLVWVVVRFNAKRNPKPATFTHNSPLEIAWTVVPIVILVFIGAFSLPVLFKQQEIPEADIFIKATGKQWYWSYEYPDEAIAFDSFMIGYGEGNLNPDISAQLAEAGYSDQEFLLATDTAVVVPVGATVVVQVTGADVIHAWTVPAFGVKQDGVPGRLAQLWFEAEQEGIYFGQCSELCGKDHAYMPITVKVVSPEDYEIWLAGAREEFAM